MATRKFISIAMTLACMSSLSYAIWAGAAPPQTVPSHSGGAGTSVDETAPSSRADFLGDAACQECHQEISVTYARTGHHLTSQLPTKESILGKFSDGANILKTSDPDLHFRMNAKENGFYETAVFWQPPDEKTRTERIDIVTGSGEKGQTYLYWRGNQLFQLPVSYWTELNGWFASPGYAEGVANFDRPIVPTCLECHATYFESIASQQAENYYKKTNSVLGISCERCHGPGRKHVESERLKRATVSSGTHSIVNPAGLPRDRRIEVCAQCHGGIGQPLAPAFSYVPGEQLENYIKLPRPDADARVDVHGNQVALTQRSRCYQNSQMTCTTCHEVHEPERAAASYSVKCLQCHKDSDCGEFVKLGAKIRENCIDCHMPVQDSNVIVAELKGKQIKARIRNHWIKVYSTRQNP
ncbi:MAG: ammonia-forming cytochrome c nitrite reductase subunit c552 [Candidatus Acidiferrales bacterium]